MFSLALLFLSTSAHACLPPPPGFMELASYRAIIDSPAVLQRIGQTPIESIRRVSGGKYQVFTPGCVLDVSIEITRTNPNAPCGGPMEFTAKPLQQTCLPR